jgi:hypothetical protein
VAAAQIDGPAPAAAAQLSSPDAQLSSLLEKGRLSLLAVVSAEGVAESRVLSPELEGRRGEFDAVLSRAAGEAGEFTAETSAGPFDVAVTPLSDGRRLVAARWREESSSLRELAAGAQTFEDFKT